MEKVGALVVYLTGPTIANEIAAGLPTTAVDRICHKNIIRSVDVSNYVAIEIDTPEDLKLARQMAKSIK